MSKIDTTIPTGERLHSAYDTLMTVLSLAQTIERACVGAIDLDGQPMRNAVESIGHSVTLLDRLVNDAAEEVESCDEYREAWFKVTDEPCAKLSESQPSAE